VLASRNCRAVRDIPVPTRGRVPITIADFSCFAPLI
jgi:hypothetical protein